MVWIAYAQLQSTRNHFFVSCRWNLAVIHFILLIFIWIIMHMAMNNLAIVAWKVKKFTYIEDFYIE